MRVSRCLDCNHDEIGLTAPARNLCRAALDRSAGPVPLASNEILNEGVRCVVSTDHRHQPRALAIRLLQELSSSSSIRAILPNTQS
ncbi:hypothetical protein BV898_02029 [Hypsibius exemplaris]|uniref:Uncharacterized protein n=1 Tax=Hypsibius exemplaris TaxID=2072580 RepID=A0A1W0X965_HYPEX|nr:hypothetical protein BV898_02029 [Hypsibius exemplaris]